jgi:hypothetical protein
LKLYFTFTRITHPGAFVPLVVMQAIDPPLSAAPDQVVVTVTFETFIPFGATLCTNDVTFAAVAIQFTVATELQLVPFQVVPRTIAYRVASRAE